MDTFVTTAIIGTGQANDALPETHTAIDTLAAQLPAEQKERSFLLTAGARAIYLQAGSQASSAPERPTAAAPETLPACSSRNAQLLTELFQNSYTTLLHEALKQLRNSGCRLPDEFLPHCITYGTAHPEYRTQLAPLLGERGRWLSQFNPAWQWVSNDMSNKSTAGPTQDAETLWQEGTLEQRQEILSHLRQETALALAWLEAVWKQEKAEVRAALLACLETGISDADQSFIEQALNDRSEEVRLLAVKLLLQIPTAPAVQRLLERADSMLDLNRSVSPNTFVFTFPEQLDLAAKNEISILKLKQDRHDGQYWFRLAIERISPRHWETRFNLTPAAFIDAVEINDMGKNLISDLIKAAFRHHTSDWYQPLLAWYIQHMLPFPLNQVGKAERDLFAAVTPTTVTEELLTPLLEDRERSQYPLLLLEAPWSASFSDKYLTMFQTYITLNPANHYSFWDSSMLPRLAVYLDPSTLDRALEIVSTERPDEDNQYWAYQRQKHQIQTLTTLLQIRQRILKEL